MTKTNFYSIDRLAQLRALQSPVRVRLVAVLRSLGEASIRDIAEQMEAAPGGLHYHVRALVAVGCVEFVGKRKVSRRMESVYRLPGKDLMINLDGRGKKYLSEVGRVYSAALRLADRTMVRSLDVRTPSAASSAEPPRLIQIVARLRKRRARELQRKLRELSEFLREHDDANAPDSYLVTLSFSEKPKKSSRRNK